MWFKNLRIYRLTKNLDLAPKTLSKHLKKNPFKPCGKVDFSRYGWVPPTRIKNDELVHALGKCILLSARRQEKIIPTAAVNEVLQDKISEFEQREARKIYRKERLRFKEDIVHSMLPHALTRSTYTHAYFDTKAKLLVIDSASANKCDEFTDCLRAALGELPAVPLACHGNVSDIMTRWVKSRRPKGFELDDECELKNKLENRNVVRCKQQDMSGEEIRTHFKNGKLVTQLALNWRNSIRFILTDDLALKRLKFADDIREQIDDKDDRQQFDQDFVVMTTELSQLINELIEECGGVQKR